MKINKAFIISSLLSVAILTGFSGVAEAHKKHSHHGYHHGYHQGHHHGHKHKHKHGKYACCTTAKERFACQDKDYSAGCKAAHSYVQGAVGGHSRSWNEGFTDCRFNVYRSCETERKAEKETCYRSRCSR